MTVQEPLTVGAAEHPTEHRIGDILEVQSRRSDSYARRFAYIDAKGVLRRVGSKEMFDRRKWRVDS